MEYNLKEVILGKKMLDLCVCVYSDNACWDYNFTEVINCMLFFLPLYIIF
jgi:hypothetical protein